MTRRALIPPASEIYTRQIRSLRCRHTGLNSPTASRQRGQSLVEFAFVLPILVIIFVAVLDLGRAVAIANLTSEAVREGARIGQVYPDQAIVQAKVDSIMSPMVADPTVTVEICTSGCSSLGSEPYVRVTATSSYVPLAGQIVGLEPGMDITSTSQLYLRNLQPSGPPPN